MCILLRRHWHARTEGFIIESRALETDRAIVVEFKTADRPLPEPSPDGFEHVEKPFHLNEKSSYLFAKRAADVTISAVALIPASVIMGLACVLIFAEDPGPVVYRQQRVGKDGKRFTFYKLRSMHINADAVLDRLRHRSDADGVAFKMKRDPRVTGVGRLIRKLSIDELPQLFSVLFGSMSLVGPRPHLPTEVACYRPDQCARLAVKPGLFCYREVKGRSDLTWEEWIRLDLQYIQERSAATDIKIFLRAFPAVLGMRGAY